MGVLDKIRVEKLTPHIGAVLHGIDLSRDLSNAEYDAIHEALMTHLVIFFRDQDLSDPYRHKIFARHFGELFDSHPVAAGSKEHPEVLRLHFDANSKHIAGSSWHSDQSYDPEPPMGTILWNHTVPLGGDTLFSSMYAAYDALSERMKKYLEGLTAFHDAEPIYRPITPDLSKRFPNAVHPVVRTHPVTGRKALYCDQNHAIKINEVSKSESRGILEFLWKHCENPSFQCRFKWEPRSVAFWDNRAAQHMALWDYYPNTRSGFRVTIRGDKSVS